MKTKFWIILILISILLGSCHSNNDVDINPQAPNIIGSASYIYMQGLSIDTANFTSNAGQVATWSITPDLPDGLVFNISAIGAFISGTPTVITPATTYTITAVNITASDTFNVVISITYAPPNIIGSASHIYRQGLSINTANFTSNAGQVATWSITPDLPDGLEFSVNATSAFISGTPTVITPATTYTITAVNITASDTFNVIISITDAPPNLALSLTQTIYTQNTRIISFGPTNTGGNVDSWSVHPNLPTGLTLDENIGFIAGTPTIVKLNLAYTLVASNEGGDSFVVVNIQVNPAAPELVNIGNQNYDIYQNITPITITNNGGNVATWSIAPDLPAGLVFSISATGAFISGAPTVITPAIAYTVTAANITGIYNTTFTIITNDIRPKINDLATQSFISGTNIVNINFINTGGLVDVWGISPDVPNGLSFNNGIISGTPTTGSTAKIYTVVASNSVGFDSASIDIAIFANSSSNSAPTIASSSPIYAIINQAISTTTLTNIGGSASIWHISPNLPSGLNFANGVISGIADTISSETTYIVTLSNDYGLDSENINISVNATTPSIDDLGLVQVVVNQVITPIVFSNTGGTASIWHISPNLASGLSFDNGIISGTVNTVSRTIYTVVASNTTGADAGSVTINVIIATGSISGQIIAAPLIVSDSDINNLLTQPYASNNSPFTPQVINNFVTVYGFVSATKTSILNNFFGYYASNGRFNQSRDVVDFYQVQLQAQQQVRMQITDYAGLPGIPNINNQLFDLDLFLYNSNGDLVDYSNALSEFEQVVVPSDGIHYIVVVAFSGISKYVLSLLDSSNSTNLKTKSMDFITHQSVVSYKSTNTQNSQIQTQITLEKTPKADAQTRVAEAGLKFEFLGHLAQMNLESYDKYQTLQTIKTNNLRAGVEYSEPNYIYRALRTPNDTHYPLQWHYPLINLPEAWDITTGAAADRDIIVAVIDTGIFLNHDDLRGKLVTGYDFISDISNAGDGDGIDADPDDVGDNALLNNSSWHGTHVAGTVGANSNNNQGVAGVSWDAKIMPLRVLGRLGGSSYDVAQAVLYAAGLENDSGTVPANKADIINLSLGGYGGSQISQDVYTRARDAGVIIIAAAGNNNIGTRFYPASYDGVVSVSAIDFIRNKAPYSNFGDRVDIAAPGGNTVANLNGDSYADGVLSTLINGSTGVRSSNYVFYQGTSMAAPHIAGVAALMKAVYPDLTPLQFDNLITSGAITDEAGATGRDDIYGYGIINALKAVQMAGNLASGSAEIPLSPINIIISPNQLNLGFSDSGLLEIQNTGQTPATITTIAVVNDNNWLSISTQTIQDNKFGSYMAVVNRTGLSDGDYSARIDFTYTDGSNNQIISTTVTISIGSSIQNDSIRSLIVLLSDDNFQIYATTLADKIGTSLYRYSFPDVPQGSYYLVAGSDIDNNGRLCELGEICGNYPVNNALALIDINGNLIDVNVVVSVLSGVLSNARNINSSVTLIPILIKRPE